MITERQKILISVGKHTWIASFINLFISILLFIHTFSVWIGLPFVIFGYWFFEYAQKKWFGGKNGWKQQLITIFVSVLSYVIYAILLTVDFI